MSRSRSRRTLIFSALVPCLAAVAACGSQLAAAGTPAPPTASASATPWWPHTGITTCGKVGYFRIGERVGGIGSCAGILVYPPESVSLQVGQTVELVLFPGFGAMGIFTSNSAVLGLVVASPDGTTATYRGEAPGDAQLTTNGAFCLDVNGNERSGICPLLDVTVLPAAGMPQPPPS
jgi:hypothetical protein